MRGFKVTMGDSYARVQHDVQMFSVASFDPLGRVKLSPFAGSRTKCYYHATLWKCVYSGTVEFTLLESLDTRGLRVGVKQFMHNVGVTPKS